MSITYYDILNKNIKSKQRLYFYECYDRHFFRSHHIGMMSKFKLIQSGGYNYEYKEDNITYNVELYENEYDKTDSDYEYINKYIYVYKSVPDIKAPCCVLSYYDNKTLHIDVLETPVKCIKINEINQEQSKELINTKYKYGDIMMKIIIKIAKERGFKNIKLEDKSTFNCLDSTNKLKYSLKNVHILTRGYPWYYKYGFKFMDKDTHNDVIDNNTKIMNMKTSDIIFDKFIKFIKKSIDSSIEIYKDTPINFNQYVIDDIKQIYENNQNNNISMFFNEFTLKHCDLMSLIYIRLFDHLKLKYINGELMMLKL
jgi:hypothetical protein